MSHWSAQPSQPYTIADPESLTPGPLVFCAHAFRNESHADPCLASRNAAAETESQSMEIGSVTFLTPCRARVVFTKTAAVHAAQGGCSRSEAACLRCHAYTLSP